jgi:hypothetical protein
VDPVFEQGKFLKTEVYNKNQIYRRVLTMRKDIFSLVFVGSFAFLYLVAFSTHARAFTLPELCDMACGDPSSWQGTFLIVCQGGGAVCVGTGHNDCICGSEDADTIIGGQGNDIIYGRGGDDTIIGASGDDFIFGEEGNDTIAGGAGDDTLSGGDGDDTIVSGGGSDVLYGGYGIDTCIGGPVNNTFYGCEDQP